MAEEYDAGGRDDAVRLEGRRGALRNVNRRRIVDGYDAADKLVLHLQGGAVMEAELAGVAPGNVLSRLGLTLDQRALSAPLRGTEGPFTRGVMAFGGTLMSTWMLAAAMDATSLLLLSPVLATGVTVAVVKWLRPRVTVGVDGLRLTGVLVSRFVSYADVALVRYDRATASIVVEKKRGALLLPVIGRSTEQIKALITRIERGRERYAAGATRPFALLDRGSRSVREWEDDMRRLVEGGGYRDAALSPSEIEAVVTNPRAPLERRMGAALAIRDNTEGRARIGVAAEQAADPEVRAGLVSVAGDAVDEAAVQRVLASLG